MMDVILHNLRLLGARDVRPARLVLRGGVLTDILPAEGPAPGLPGHDLGGWLVSPGLCDLQVNGGDGLMLGECRSVDDLVRLARAHLAEGVTHLLPTLISDTAEEITRIADLVAAARAAGHLQIAGLHLEGPHLTRKGAHEAALLRPMTAEDLASYVAIAPRVGVLKITLAPEQVSPAQIAALTAVGILVALGHSDCDYDSAVAAFAAGARTATHLFNAMGPLHHRTPGLAGAALDHGVFGLIADGHHVHPALLRLAMARARGAYLVSDAMAVAGTDADGFTLGGRRILRAGGRLTTEDGTLAGADLTMPQAMARLMAATGLDLADALRMASHTPRALIGRTADLEPGETAFCVWDGPETPFVHRPDGWLDGRAP